MKALRTSLALHIAPWLKPKEQTREWKITGGSVGARNTEMRGLATLVQNNRSPFKDLNETKPYRFARDWRAL